MKKLILCILVIASAASLNAQGSCFPNPLYIIAGLPGLWPNPQMGPLPDGNLNQAYSQTFTVVVPADTTIDVSQFGLPFGMVTVSINNLDLVGVGGLPAGMSYVCDYAGCSWLNNDFGCFKINGTPTVAGVYQVACSTSLNINVPNFGAIQTPPTPVMYDLTILGPTAVEDPRASGLSILDISPNPSSGRTTLHFTTEEAGPASIHVMDAQGRRLHSESTYAPLGDATLALELAHLPKGLYLVEIQSISGRRAAKRLVLQ